MPEIKEKPKGKVKAKQQGKGREGGKPVLGARQAAKLLRDKYVQQLDQRPEEVRESPSNYAPDKVEQAGRWAVGEVSRALTDLPTRRGEAPLCQDTPVVWTGGTAPCGASRVAQ